jgi:hypothetical protein
VPIQVATQASLPAEHPSAESDDRLPAMPVVQLLDRPAVPVAIAEHGPPEGKHLGDVERVDGDHDVLHLGRLRRRPELLGCGRDAPAREFSDDLHEAGSGGKGPGAEVGTGPAVRGPPVLHAT